MVHDVTPLSLEEKLRCAEARGREVEAEKHFFDLAQPHFPGGFSVRYRNPGHWDVSARQVAGKASAWSAAHPNGQTSLGNQPTERAFRIRGEPGAVVLIDERWDPHRPHPREPMTFRTVAMAMLWIVDELMREPSAVKSGSAG